MQNKMAGKSHSFFSNKNFRFSTSDSDKKWNIVFSRIAITFWLGVVLFFVIAAVAQFAGFQ
jgi:hypothetical protein